MTNGSYDNDDNITTTIHIMIAHLNLDLVEEKWVQKIVGADIVVIFSRQWWFKVGIYRSRMAKPLVATSVVHNYNQNYNNNNNTQSMKKKKLLMEM